MEVRYFETFNFRKQDCSLCIGIFKLLETRVSCFWKIQLFGNKRAQFWQKAGCESMRALIWELSTVGNNCVCRFWFWNILETSVWVVWELFNFWKQLWVLWENFSFRKQECGSLRNLQLLEAKLCAGLYFFKFLKQKGPRFKNNLLIKTSVRSWRKF